MTIDTNTMISITEANQNFSKVAKVVDEHGTAVILKNNVPSIAYSKFMWKIISQAHPFCMSNDILPDVR